MNIFVLDRIPETAATYHCDKHVVKMPLETAQILSAVHWRYGNEPPYALTHPNHPCTLWAGQTVENYRWLVRLGLALCKEYTHRYDKRHGSERVIQLLRMPPLGLTARGFTAFAKAMPEQYIMEDTVSSYRAYYQNEKASICAWTRREIPPFMVETMRQLSTSPSTSEV
jgi:hypothetical protein